MKKIYILLIILCVFSISASIFVGLNVYEEKDKVTFVEQTIFGDKAAAEGLELVLNNHLKYHFFWETTYTLDGKNAVNCDTEYSFSTIEKEKNLQLEIFDTGNVYRFDECYVVFHGDSMTFSSYGAGEDTFRFTVDKNNELYGKSFTVSSESKMAFDGEKLAIVGMSNSQESLGGFYLAVYDKSGMLYWGEYQSSLLSKEIGLDYVYNRLRDGKGLYQIAWK